MAIEGAVGVAVMAVSGGTALIALGVVAGVGGAAGGLWYLYKTYSAAPKNNAPEIPLENNLRRDPIIPPIKKSKAEPIIESTKEAIKKIINGYSEYACSDYERFPHVAKSEKINEIKTRYLSYKKHVHKHMFETQANVIAAKPGQYSINQLTTVEKLIDNAKSACCTTFAMSAAAKLRKHFQNLRIEIVSSKPTKGGSAHCFLLINREEIEGENSEKLSPKETWGDNVLVIDPWLVSLGQEGVYTTSDYYMKTYLNNEKLNRNFDSNNAQLVSTNPSYERSLQFSKSLLKPVNNEQNQHNLPPSSADRRFVRNT